MKLYCTGINQRGTKFLATGIQQNIQRFWGRVLDNRNDGAFVRVSMFSDKAQLHSAATLTESFAENILNLLPNYWPDEK